MVENLFQTYVTCIVVLWSFFRYLQSHLSRCWLFLKKTEILTRSLLLLCSLDTTLHYNFFSSWIIFLKILFLNIIYCAYFSCIIADWNSDFSGLMMSLSWAKIWKHDIRGWGTLRYQVSPICILSSFLYFSYLCGFVLHVERQLIKKWRRNQH